MEGDLHTYLVTVLSSFKDDPADNSFQRGYLSALLELAKEVQPATFNMYQELETQCTAKGAQ